LASGNAVADPSLWGEDRFWATDQAARLLLITVPGGIEDYFRQINSALSDEVRQQIGERYRIRVVPE
jgi:hypothetical protein